MRWSISSENCASEWAHLEGLLEGLREAITGRAAAS